ncbi:MAG TPA: type II toxin-antitoxin system VapC family toxin [Terriglobales bacterium]
MSSFVLHASVALCWCFENQSNAYSDTVFARIEAGAEVWVPFHWQLEIGNALARAERQKALTPDLVGQWARELMAFGIQVDQPGAARGLQETFALARVSKLSNYDAAYVELASRAQMPLATLDHALRDAAMRRGVAWFNAE